MFIRTRRLFLRPAWLEDRDDLYDAICDERVVRNLSRVPWPYTPLDAETFIRLPVTLRCPRFLVTLPGAEGARVIGGVGLNDVEGNVHLGYRIAHAHWGQGYASEAARAVVDLARVLGHGRITAVRAVDNPASGRVLEKLGFARTGRFMDVTSAGRGASVGACEYALQLCQWDDGPVPDLNQQAA